MDLIRSTASDCCPRIERVPDRLFEGEEPVLHLTRIWTEALEPHLPPPILDLFQDRLSERQEPVKRLRG